MSPKAKTKTKVPTTRPLDTASLLADFEAELSRKEAEIAAAEAQLAPLRSEADRLRGVIAALQGFDSPAVEPDATPGAPAGRSDKASRIEAVRGLLEAQVVAGGPKVTRSVVAERLGVSPGYATALLAEARKAQAAA